MTHTARRRLLNSDRVINGLRAPVIAPEAIAVLGTRPRLSAAAIAKAWRRAN